MAARPKAYQDLQRIVDFHNQLRRVCPTPGPLASFVNENTVVRAAAVTEHYLRERAAQGRRGSAGGGKRKKDMGTPAFLGDWCRTADWPDVCARTLFVLRHFVVHLEGLYRPRGLREWTADNLLPAYHRFYKCLGVPNPRQGQPLRLPAQEVIVPLLLGCRDYFATRRRAPTRSRPEP